MSELLITSSLDPIKEGDVFPKETQLPQHVTIWQYFQLPDFHTEAFIHDAAKSLEAFGPFEIIGDEFAEFGPNNDVAVRRVWGLEEA